MTTNIMRPDYTWIVTGRNNSEPQKRLRVMLIVCKVFGVTVDQIKGDGKVRKFFEARMAYSYIIKTHFKDTLQAIGDQLNIDHTSVLYQIRRCEELIFIKDHMKDIINDIEQELKLQNLI